MQARDIEPSSMRLHELRLNLIERHRRGVDNAGAGGAMRQQFRRHDGAGIEADRTARQEIAAAHRDQVGGAGAGADEINRHGERSEAANAQVTGPTAVLGAISRAEGPPAAKAAASATEGRPVSATTRSDRVAVRG